MGGQKDMEDPVDSQAFDWVVTYIFSKSLNYTGSLPIAWLLRTHKFLFYNKEELSPLYFTRFIKIKPPNYMTFINFPRGT